MFLGALVDRVDSVAFSSFDSNICDLSVSLSLSFFLCAICFTCDLVACFRPDTDEF